METAPQRVTLYSYRPREHDLHPGCSTGFWDLVQRVRQLRQDGQLDSLCVEIPVTRFNFLDLMPTVHRAQELVGGRRPVRWPWPRDQGGESLVDGHRHFLSELNELLQGKVRLRQPDRLVDQLLERIQAQYGADQLEVLRGLRRCCQKRQHPWDHLRVLGAMLDDTFIGPSVLVLSLYNRCNLNCAHCWIHNPATHKKISPEHLDRRLSLPQIKAVIDDGVEMGVYSFTLLGEGEAMLHPDFEAIVRHIRARSPAAHIVVFTNGIAMDRPMAELLVQERFDCVCCSIPAVTEQTWKRVNPGRPAALLGRIQENLQALRELKREGWTDPGEALPRLRLNFVLSRLNYHEVEEMARLAAEVGAAECRFQVIQAVKDLVDLALQPEMVQFLVEAYPRIEEIGRQAGFTLEPSFRRQIDSLYGLDNNSQPPPRLPVPGPEPPGPEPPSLEPPSLEPPTPEAPSPDNSPPEARRDEAPHQPDRRQQPPQPPVQPRQTHWSRSQFTGKGCLIGWGLVLVKATGDVSFCCGLKIVDSLGPRSLKEIWYSADYQRYRIAAKDLLANRHLEFSESVYDIDRHLYNHRCEMCNNIDINNHFNELIEQSGLKPYIPGLPGAEG